MNSEPFVSAPTEMDGWRTKLGLFPAKLYERRGPKSWWSGVQDMITVKTLARAIEKRLGGTSSEALAESRTVMSYFGFRSEIIDNAIQPEDRKLFYALHDAGLLQTFWETVPLLDGRNWRIFYWALNERDVDRILTVDEAPPSEPLYNTLPDEAWGRSAPGA